MESIDLDLIDGLFERMQIRYGINLSSYDSILNFLTKNGMTSESKEKKILSRLIANVYDDTVEKEDVKIQLDELKKRVPEQFQKFEQGKMIKGYFKDEWDEWLQEKDDEYKKAREKSATPRKPVQTFHDIKGKVKIFTRYPAGTKINGVSVGGRIISHN